MLRTGAHLMIGATFQCVRRISDISPVVRNGHGEVSVRVVQPEPHQQRSIVAVQHFPPCTHTVRVVACTELELEGFLA